jgi:hypothetical protein
MPTTASALEGREEGTASNAKEAPSINPTPSENDHAAKRPVAGHAPTRGPKRQSVREPVPEPMSATGTVSITVRLPADIPARLLRVSTERKLNRIRPWTQQEIMAEALAQWLSKNGY